MKRMVLTDTHIDPAGNLLLQWRKQFSDDGITWENLDFHRTLVEFGGDIDATLAAVDAHAKSMGITDGVDPKSVARIKAHATIAWSDTLPLTDAAVEARGAVESARQIEL